VWDLPSDLISQYFQVAQKIVNHYRKILKTKFVMSFIYGYDTFFLATEVNNGKAEFPFPPIFVSEGMKAISQGKICSSGNGNFFVIYEEDNFIKTAEFIIDKKEEKNFDF